MMMWRGMRSDARLYLLRALSGRGGGAGKAAPRQNGAKSAPSKTKPAVAAKKSPAR